MTALYAQAKQQTTERGRLVLDEEDVEFLDVDNIYQKFIYLREENELLKTKIKNLKLKLNEKGNDKESV